MKKRFMILGCQRSGTTVLRLALNSHPDIYCWDEWHGYEQIDLDDDDKVPGSLVGFKLPIYTELMTEYKFYERFPYPILFVRRPVQEVVSSMFGLVGFVDNEVPTVRGWLADQNRPRAKQFFSEDDLNGTWDRAARLKFAAAYWGYKDSTYQLLAEVIPERLKEIQYHDLVNHPEQTIRGILEFLGVAWHQSCLEHHLLSHDEVVNGVACGNTLVSRKIDTASLYEYLRGLTPAEISQLQKEQNEIHKSNISTGRDCPQRKVCPYSSKPL